ncbi:MAG TPA: SDR family NAD(P)-dependent oxidoreductase [Tepidiformaceae bacterium]|nr:SDR family NAD(P)-dependent oxidoreductase [Tepidiformaceae bacterium]
MDRKAGVVTGAGGDIGRAVCEHLAARQVAMLCVDRDEASVRATAEACVKAGAEAEWMVADVTVEGDASAYASKARSLWGEANFFFNNAGIEGVEAPLLSYPVEQWDRVLAVNLRGVFLGIKAMAPILHHADTPRIVNTASVAGLNGTPMLAAYGASKHAVIGLTKTAAIELAPLGISVNAICPGPVESQMMRRIEAGVAPGQGEAARSRYEQNIPAGRYAGLNEVAMLATYLLLEAPIYLTGQAIAIDGGLVVS